jgi:hypothetical protein
MKKPLTFSQRLSLQVNRAVSSPMGSKEAQFPYGFSAYAKAANACKGKKLLSDWR